MKLINVHLAALACIAKLASADLINYSFIFYPESDGTGDPAYAASYDCASLESGETLSSIKTHCDVPLLCKMKSDKFCIKPYNAIGCSADTYIETGALNYTAGGKDEILKLTPARAFRVDEGDCFAPSQ